MKKFAAVLLALSLAACAVAEESVRIVMSTDEGSIKIDLYTEAAPITAGNFLKLTDNGDLDGGSFYRVVTYENDRGAPKIEVIQGGRGNAAAGAIDAI
ncbi:MAG: peptidylprolyl isomerase, partial [Woeseiaceae bacterium]